MRASFGLATLALAAAPAMSQDLRELCADRPGLDTPACTVDQGHLQAELGQGDWTRDVQPDSRTDTVLAADLLLRYGVGATTELRFGWTAFGHQRVRDRTTGMIDKAARTGDVTLGLKQNLANPDGSGFSLAVLPEVTIPVGRAPIGGGDWGARLEVPIDYDLADGLELELTPEVDAAVDGDGHGRHVAYGTVAGIEIDLTKTLALSVEGEVMRDRDPDQPATMTLAGVSLAYRPQARTQFDVGGNFGLNHSAPGVELYFGVSRKF